MFVVRAIGMFAGLFLLALGMAWVLTRDQRYLKLAWTTLQVLVLLIVCFGLVYVFERVFLMF